MNRLDGVRHDSGDPLEFADKTIAHYRQYGIDPLSKTIIFSDRLDYEKVKHIAEYCKGKIAHYNIAEKKCISSRLFL